MQLSPHIEALQNDLAAMAGMADEATRETVQRIAGALDSSLRLRMLEAVTEAANEISGQLASGQVEIRLAGGDPQLVVAEQAEEAPAPPAAGDDALTARITLRLPEGLKAKVEAAASFEGTSVNSWLIQAIARSVDRRGGGPARSSRRISGWARS
jgi:HicB family